MTIPKKYIHDKLILLLLSANTFLTLLIGIFVFLRLDTQRTEGYIVQYRANLGLNAFKVGNISAFVSIVVFAVFVLVLHFLLSVKVYHLRRQLSIVILGFGLLLLVLSLIVSNSLLVLR